MGVDACAIVKFTKKIASLNPREFVETYLVKTLQAYEVVVGSDFHFGKNREGDVHLLQELGKLYGFRVAIVPPLMKRRHKISSTTIRNLVNKGRLKEIKNLLGRSFSLLGKVQRGDGRGRKIGFPTANINISCDETLLRGVYIVEIVIDGKIFQGMANVGHRPSFSGMRKKINVEVHIFGFKRNIYGQEIEIRFLKRIRDEKRFSSIRQLVEQLKKDEQAAKKFF